MLQTLLPEHQVFVGIALSKPETGEEMLLLGLATRLTKFKSFFLTMTGLPMKCTLYLIFHIITVPCFSHSHTHLEFSENLSAAKMDASTSTASWESSASMMLWWTFFFSGMMLAILPRVLKHTHINTKAMLLKCNYL